MVNIGKELLDMKFINKIEDPNITLNTINHIEIISFTLVGYKKVFILKNNRKRIWGRK